MAIGSEVFRIVVEMAANLRGVPNKVAAAMDMMANKTKTMARTSRAALAEFNAGLVMPLDRFKLVNRVAGMSVRQFKEFAKTLDPEVLNSFGIALEKTGKFYVYNIGHGQRAAVAQRAFISEITTGGGKLANSIRMQTHGMRGFRMELLSVMFFGMNLSKMFGQWNNQVYGMLGLTDYFNVAMQDMVLTAILPVTDALYGFIDGLMNLPDSVKSAIGWLMIIGQTMGQVLFFVGSLMLGVGGLVTAFGKLPGAVSGALGKLVGFILKPLGLGQKGAMGFFTTMGQGMSSVLKLGSKLADAFKGVMSFVAKWAGKAVKVTASIVAKFGKYFLNFFSKAGEWAVKTVDTIVSFTGKWVGNITRWITAGGRWLWKSVKTTVNIGASLGSKLLAFFTATGSWIRKVVTTTVSVVVRKLDAFMLWLMSKFPIGISKVGLGLTLTLTVVGLAAGYELAKLVDKLTKPPEPISLRHPITGEVVSGRISAIDWLKMYLGARPGETVLEAWSKGRFPAFPTFGRGLETFYKPYWRRYQYGGLATRPTFALLGEAGPEAVIPLTYVAGRPTLAVGQSAEAGSFTFNNVINVEATVSNDMDVSRLADRLDAELYDRFRRRYFR